PECPGRRRHGHERWLGRSRKRRWWRPRQRRCPPRGGNHQKLKLFSAQSASSGTTLGSRPFSTASVKSRGTVLPPLKTALELQADLMQTGPCWQFITDSGSPWGVAKNERRRWLQGKIIAIEGRSSRVPTRVSSRTTT